MRERGEGELVPPRVVQELIYQLYCPVPLSGTEDGLGAGALSVNCKLAVRSLLLDGVNVTLTEQVAPGAKPAPPIGQVLDSIAKSAALLPPILIRLKIVAEPPVLVTVTV